MANRCAWLGWGLLRLAVTVAVIGALVYAARWDPGSRPTQAPVETCTDPPCFGGDGLPSLRDVPIIAPFLGYGLAILLGVPSLILGGWDLLRRRPTRAARRLLVFAGPALVLIGTEIVPHVLSPCLLAELLGREAPGLCERTESGLDITDRWHALVHTLVGAVPMVALYGVGLRRWRPDLVSPPPT